MTQSIANMSKVWMSNANSYIAIGMNISSLGIAPNSNSSLLNFKVDSNTVFNIDAFGNANANNIISNNLYANTANIPTLNTNNIIVTYTVTATLNGNVVGKVISTGNSSFSGLPNANTAGVGARAFVYDATTTTFASAVIGGGANRVPVYSNGRNWLIG